MFVLAEALGTQMASPLAKLCADVAPSVVQAFSREPPVLLEIVTVAESVELAPWLSVTVSTAVYDPAVE
ncbi:hypothetical protein swp_3313 [Shewanella piezotolerans WP3]|uniref:Uncharacterized protein n=1 Tax=Shewanella piezotolerans (strain WP3 / JCM 13877) TaxID=225849 RepID=B8CRK8_SHEPW|nr:hypothetical protein swp_3313 [Shewanella piezotolerans WP3]